MNTSQITHALEQDPITSQKFCGVFSSNNLPQTIDKYPCGFVANTDPSNEPGKHWVAFYFTSEKRGEFFDSYGQPPDYYKMSFKRFLDKQSDEWDFNQRKLQSAWTDVCGQYCIFYLSHRARGLSMNKIVQLFSSNTMLNDKNVSQFVKTHFRIELKNVNVNLNQFSKLLIQ